MAAFVLQMKLKLMGRIMLAVRREPSKESTAEWQFSRAQSGPRSERSSVPEATGCATAKRLLRAASEEAAVPPGPVPRGAHRPVHGILVGMLVSRHSSAPGGSSDSDAGTFIPARNTGRFPH